VTPKLSPPSTRSRIRSIGGPTWKPGPPDGPATADAQRAGPAAAAAMAWVLITFTAEIVVFRRPDVIVRKQHFSRHPAG
jgi:hypothetical protein